MSSPLSETELQHYLRSAGLTTPLFRLAAKAFQHILSRKQSKYGEVLQWLQGMIESSVAGNPNEALKLERIANNGKRVFCGYKY